VLVAGAVVGLIYMSLGFWATIGGLVAAVAVGFLFSSTKALLLTVFVAMPLIDMLWFAGTDVAGVSVNAQSMLRVVVFGVTLMVAAMKRIAPPRILLLPMVAVVLINLWALANTPQLGYATEYLIRIICGFPLVFVVPTIVSQLPAPTRMLQLFLAVMALVCVTVLLQPLGIMPYTNVDGGYSRATGFYYHPWDVARYLVITVPLLLAMLDKPFKYFSRQWPYLALVLAVLAVDYFTFLKAAWIAVLVQILLWLVLSGRWPVALGVLIVTSALVAFPLRSGFLSVFSDVWQLSDAGTRGQALSGRVFVWSQYWEGLRSTTLDRLVLGQSYQPTSLGAGQVAPHDDYLRILVMNGILGILAYFWLIIAAAVSLGRSVNELAKQKGIEWRIGIGVQCLLAAYLLMGLTADPSSYPALTLYLWLLIGLVRGYAARSRESESPDGPSTHLAWERYKKPVRFRGARAD
jgi:hypothetical protein